MVKNLARLFALIVAAPPKKSPHPLPKVHEFRSQAIIGLIAVMIIFGLVVNFKSMAATLTGDLNNDNTVDVFDLSMLLTNWNKTGVPGDLNNDSTINVFDLSILLSNWGKTGSTITPTPTTALTPTPTASAGCTVSSSAKLQDIDPTDTAEGVWPRVAGQKVTIYYATQVIPAKYAAAVKVGTDTWSMSPCFNLITVVNCPAGVYCVKFAMAATAGDGSTDAEEGGNETTSGGVRTAADITLYSDLLDKETQNGYTATIVHEMGHSITLVHRLNPNDLMNSVTSDTTSPVPDAIDYANLLVYYGTKI